MKRIDTVSLLSSLLHYSGRTIHGASFASREDLQPLIDLGILEPKGFIAEMACTECDHNHVATVFQTAGGFQGICSRLGSVFEIEDDLAAYRVHASQFANVLASSVDKQRRRSQPSGDPFLWSIGSFLFQELRVSVYLLLDAANLGRFNDARIFLDAEPRSDGMAVLTNDIRDLSQLVLPQAGRVVPLVECIDVDETGLLTLDCEWLAKRVLPTSVLATSKAGRPRSAQQLATELIRDLDRDGTLQRSSGGRDRHRALLRAAKERFGEQQKLSRGPCDEAWAVYISATVGASRNERDTPSSGSQ